MNIEKYIMLKATLADKDTITLSLIKDQFNVDSNEALEMLNNLIQEGIVEAFASDGTHFKIIKDDSLTNLFSF